MSTASQDAEHLRLLSIFHYVVGALAALVACIPLLHLFLGIAMVSGWQGLGRHGHPAADLMGWFFIVFAGFFVLGGWTLAVCLMVAGRFLARHRHYTFCLVTAGVACIFAPFGTVLGVFTLIVLLRDPVKALFDRDPAPPGATVESRA